MKSAIIEIVLGYYENPEWVLSQAVQKPFGLKEK